VRKLIGFFAWLLEKVAVFLARLGGGWRDRSKLRATVRHVPGDPPFGVDVALDRYTFKEISAARFDGLSLPFATGSIDVTVCCYVLHHLSREQAKALIGEMVRVTRWRILVLEDSLPQFDWFYRQRNRFHRINAVAIYGEESATYRPPSDEAMFMTHDQWRTFASEIAGVSGVGIESLQDVTRWRHHSLIDLSVDPRSSWPIASGGRLR
jgi:hypothetical protein